VKSADSNWPRTRHTEHFADLHSAGADRAVPHFRHYFKVARFHRAVAYNTVDFADVQGASADRAIPRYRDDLAHGKMVWANRAVGQASRQIELNSCWLGVGGYCRFALGSCFAAVGDRFTFGAESHNFFLLNYWALIAGFGKRRTGTTAFLGFLLSILVNY